MKLLISLFFSFIFFLGFSQTYSLKDFYKSDTVLDNKIDSIFNLLNDTSRVGQMIVPAIGRLGKSRDHVLALAQKGWIGGILLLNGTFEEFSKDVKNYDSTMIAKGHLPLIFSADAEPTLVNRKIIGSQKVPYTNTIHSMDSVEIIASIISDDLNKIGINQNYAPVIDASPNKVVSNRSFGLNMDTVISIMVAHLAVKNNEEYNTFGLPSTCSRNIVTNLLKDSLGFEGLIVTDALNMGGVANLENNGLKAAQAGCDQLLMPIDEEKVLLNILDLIEKDQTFRKEIYDSIKKIIRLKICLGKLI